MSERAKAWRDIRRYIILVICAVIALAAVQYGSGVHQRESDLDTCERANDGRQSIYDGLRADAEDARYFIGQVDDPEIKVRWKLIEQRKSNEAESFVRFAQQQGTAAPGSPRIDCARVIPPVELSPL